MSGLSLSGIPDEMSSNDMNDIFIRRVMAIGTWLIAGGSENVPATLEQRWSNAGYCSQQMHEPAVRVRHGAYVGAFVKVRWFRAEEGENVPAWLDTVQYMFTVRLCDGLLWLRTERPPD
jgi:hypothetical protein